MPVEPPTRELERRQQVAVDLLKSLGLLRRQVSSITAWQVSTLAVLALLAGVLLGVATGRWVGAVRRRPWYLRAGALNPAMVILVIVLAVLQAADAVAACRNIALSEAATRRADGAVGVQAREPRGGAAGGCPGGRHTSDSPGSTLACLGPSG
jgi:hypothetical protein